MKLGLALSGGGIKGAAHIGALKALEEANIKINMISGTSSGSIIAALYAIGYKPNEILKVFKSYAKHINYFSFNNLLKLVSGIITKRKITITGFNNGKKLEKIINKLSLDKGINLISDVKMPLIIPAVSLYDGKVYIFTNQLNKRSYNDSYLYKGNVKLAKCVRASSSFPGIFEPTKVENDLLLDGGIRENTPWKELKKLGASFVISIVFDTFTPKTNYTSFLEIVDKSLNIMMHELENYELHKAQFILRIKTDKISLLDSSKIDELYQIGYSATKKEIEKIKLLTSASAF